MNERDGEAVALKKEESQLLIGRREAGASDTIPTERSVVLTREHWPGNGRSRLS